MIEMVDGVTQDGSRRLIKVADGVPRIGVIFRL